MFLTRRFVSRLPWICGEPDFLQVPLIPDYSFEPYATFFHDGAQFNVFDVLSETVGVEVHGSEPSKVMWLRFNPSRLVAFGSAECCAISDGLVYGRLVAKKKEE